MTTCYKCGRLTSDGGDTCESHTAAGPVTTAFSDLRHLFYCRKRSECCIAAYNRARTFVIESTPRYMPPTVDVLTPQQVIDLCRKLFEG